MVANFPLMLMSTQIRTVTNITEYLVEGVTPSTLPSPNAQMGVENSGGLLEYAGGGVELAHVMELTGLDIEEIRLKTGEQIEITIDDASGTVIGAQFI